MTREVPRQPWFDWWTEVVAPLGFAYTRNVAHLHISPRATVSMWGVPDKAVFARMLDTDVRWLFRLLSQCPRGRGMFIAGTVSKAEYMLNSSAGGHSPQRFDSIPWALPRTIGVRRARNPCLCHGRLHFLREGHGLTSMRQSQRRIV